MVMAVVPQQKHNQSAPRKVRALGRFQVLEIGAPVVVVEVLIFAV